MENSLPFLARTWRWTEEEQSQAVFARLFFLCCCRVVSVFGPFVNTVVSTGVHFRLNGAEEGQIYMNYIDDSLEPPSASARADRTEVGSGVTGPENDHTTRSLCGPEISGPGSERPGPSSDRSECGPRHSWRRRQMGGGSTCMVGRQKFICLGCWPGSGHWLRVFSEFGYFVCSGWECFEFGLGTSIDWLQLYSAALTGQFGVLWVHVPPGYCLVANWLGAFFVSERGLDACDPVCGQGGTSDLCEHLRWSTTRSWVHTNQAWIQTKHRSYTRYKHHCNIFSNVIFFWNMKKTVFEVWAKLKCEKNEKQNLPFFSISCLGKHRTPSAGGRSGYCTLVFTAGLSSPVVSSHQRVGSLGLLRLWPRK